jgi:hypothetical protein
MSETKVLPFPQFDELLTALGVASSADKPFLYECYQDALEGASNLSASNPIIAKMPINSVQLILYIVNENGFYLAMHPEKKLDDLKKTDDYERLIISIAVDKYFTNEHLDYKMGAFANRFLPEISTISLYLNFILGMLGRYKQGDPNQTLIVDIMNKGFSMAKCIVTLLTNGFETEAFSTWRTLHENESILYVLVKYGKPVIDDYLTHLRYAVAFRGGFNKEETDATFVEIKENMKKIGLKSKDMKRYIEYGWLLSVPGVNDNPDFKLNFRDGVERCAGLRELSKVYEMSSEIAHSSPLLIYSRKNYFYLVTMINLYQSFFRLEKVFSSLYLSSAPEADKNQYLAMRKLYYDELLTVYAYEKKRFEALVSSGKKEELPPKDPLEENKEED